MEKTRITQYRERLDRTLASPELTSNEKIKTLIKNQLNTSSQCETIEIGEALLEKRTMEVSDLLDMLRSASVNEHDAPKCPETAHGAWKLKQDTEELRVMYREGPRGSPFHTLLAEGYVNGPIDVCLCVSWESTLYRKWWPQITFPAFKIVSSKCLQKVQVGDQVASVRMKVPWPLTSREAVVHYFEFEYFQDDLIVILLNTIRDGESIDETTHGFIKDGIQEAKDVVRIDVVGGFALQKVSEGRSYFRTIANMDIKMDFVPPWLINFISRQLIGSSFKLYQKVVSSSIADEEYSKALEDPMYTRIRQALYSDNQHNIPLEQKELKKETCTLYEENSVKSVQNEQSDMDGKIQTRVEGSESSLGKVKVTSRRTFGEIEEERDDDSTTVEHYEKDNTQMQSDVIAEKYHENGDKRANISQEVQQALGMLDKAISVIREYRLSAQTKIFSTFSEEERPDIKDGAGKEPDIRSNSEVCVEVPENDAGKRIAKSSKGTISGRLDSRRTASNSFTGERNRNKIVPASPEENHLSFSVYDHIDLSNLKDGTTVKLQNSDNHTHYNKHVEVTGADGDGPKGVKMERRKKRRSCFLLSFF